MKINVVVLLLVLIYVSNDIMSLDFFVGSSVTGRDLAEPILLSIMIVISLPCSSMRVCTV